jgi:chloramphenicol-sensitive protein RarD
MIAPGRQSQPRESLTGGIFAAAAFLIWGMSPIYWKQLLTVPSLEIVAHRIVWSPLFLIPVMFAQKRWGEFAAAFRKPGTILGLLVTTLLISANWLIFIWAVNNEHVLETSIGYYITPLVNVLMGMIFLRERLRPLQAAALILAAGSVFYLTLDYGRFPWIALSLGFSFSLYGLIRKIMAVSSITGLMVEMVLPGAPALAYLVCLDAAGTGAFLHTGTRIDLLLPATILCTSFPLFLFTFGTRRLHLSTLGFLQYITPSGYFLLAVFYYHEPVSPPQIWTFFSIWVALCFYSTDSVLFYRLMSKRSS